VENETNKLFGRNIKKGSQKLFGHPLTLEVHLHGEHLCPMCLAKQKKLKEINLIGMPKILIMFERQQKSMGGEKPKGKSKDNQATHLQGWTTNPIEVNRKTKCSIAKRTIKVKPMMWVLSMKEEKYKEIPS